MALPTNRDEFKQFCLRALGAPMIEINVTEEQVDDRLDEALSFYAEYHYDGTERQYYKHIVTAQDITNGYVTVPDNILGAIQVWQFDIMGTQSNDIFNVRYQIALNDLYHLTSFSLVPYYMTKQHLGLITDVLVGRKPIRFNRRTNRIYIDTDWESVDEGRWLIFECFSIIDPEDYPNVWKDRWLQEYTTAKIQKQWGTNLTKFTGVPLPGGMMFNGEDMLRRATEEIRRLEDRALTDISPVPMDFVG